MCALCVCVCVLMCVCVAYVNVSVCVLACLRACVRACVRWRLQWTAPEVLNGEAYTAASEVYAVAITMYELLTCKEPYGDMPMQAVLNRCAPARLPAHLRAHLAGATLTRRVLQHERPPLDEDCRAARVPGALAEAVKQCWHSDPAERPALEALAAALAHEAWQSWYADDGGDPVAFIRRALAGGGLAVRLARWARGQD